MENEIGNCYKQLEFKQGGRTVNPPFIHVTDSDILSTHRLKKVLAEEEPLLISFDQDAWANNLAYDQLDLEQYLQLFQMLRCSMQTILGTLTSDQYERVGVYADAGRFTFKELLEFRVEHVRDHLAQIERVRDAYKQSLT
ncbi:DinB family protein [Brevibacillus sp. 179-C9.3 HS]|uniref:DinB family protein n=1 Tax=unclassified Brevibacillus TaxID=2684853 RepID=UPI0039A126E0